MIVLHEMFNLRSIKQRPLFVRFKGQLFSLDFIS